MDRRQRKSREAIFKAFNNLLARKNYHKITVQDIIDEADIGRTTFYSHFETKDELLKETCKTLFDHVFSGASNATCNHKFKIENNNVSTIITHMLYHLRDNQKNIIEILTCDNNHCVYQNNEMFLKFFQHNIDDFFRQYMTIKPQQNIPEEFLINHISGSFVNMVKWWLKGGLKETPEELTNYFEAVIYPILQPVDQSIEKN